LQRGQAMILTVVLVVFGVLAAIYTTANTRSVSLSNRQADDTARTLTEVKNALIAWSAARTPITGSLNRRPGELPCPDNDNSGTDSGSCAAGAIGRVPWKSLGIPEPKDSTGETLWYAISDKFRNFAMSSDPITSDTVGDLTVYHGSSATTLTSQAVAVIFAPGASLGTQDRSCTVGVDCTAAGQCTTSPASLTSKCNPTNYLEATGGGNNAQTGGAFIQATASSSFNDRLLVITNADLMPAVEPRVAREMMSILEQYRLYRVANFGTSDYPSADLSDGNYNDKYNRHRFPCGTAYPSTWASAGISLPTWLTNGCGSNGWASVIFYAVAPNRMYNNDCSNTCNNWTTTCSGTTTSSTSWLTVTNNSNRVADVCASGATPVTCTPTVMGNTNTAKLILITPGSTTYDRSGGWPPSSVTTITGYFDDSANADNDWFNCYAVPTSTNYNRDRIYVVP
jgi:hypothetical protein